MKTKKIIVTSLGDSVVITKNMYFVCATDNWLSGWGCSENKTTKRVVICNTCKQAQRIADSFKRNPDSMMNYINISSRFPRYSSDRYVVCYSLYEDFNNDGWMKFTNISE